MDNQNFPIPPVVPESDGRQPLSRSVKIIVYSVVGILILAGLGIGGYYLLNNNNQLPVPSPTPWPSLPIETSTSTPTPSPTDSVTTGDSDNSPFGIVDSVDNYDLIKDIGITSIRYGGKDGVNWDGVEGRYPKDKEQFSGWKWPDNLFKETYDKGIEMSVVLAANENPVKTNRLDKYSAFVSSAAERYDGDGINDSEGSPIVAYWEIENEPDWMGDIWKHYPKDYALTLKTAYKAIKSANPNSKVAIGSIAIDVSYLEQVFIELEKLKESEDDISFDVFNFHFYGTSSEYGRDPIDLTKQIGQDLAGGPGLDQIKDLLTKYGYSNVGIIMTEVGTDSGVPLTKTGVIQTETEQATSLIKRYVYPVSNGVDRIYWLSIKYSKGLGESGYFVEVALMDKNTYKKLAYYSYKKMVEVLNGSEWDNVQTIQESNDVYVYKFTKDGKPIWVAWNDNTESKTISLNIGNIKSVTITEAVPKYGTGEEVTDYNTAFNTESKNAQNEQITLTLKDIPVFIATQ